MSKQDRMTDIKVYRESIEPGTIWVWVSWKDLDGYPKHKCFPNTDSGEESAKEFASKLRNFVPIYKELEF